MVSSQCVRAGIREFSMTIPGVVEINGHRHPIADLNKRKGAKLSVCSLEFLCLHAWSFWLVLAGKEQLRQERQRKRHFFVQVCPVT